MKDFIDKLKKVMEETAFSGVISIHEENQAVWQKTAGFRDMKNRLTHNTDTLLGTASGTKLFTALAVGRLIEMGKLSMDTKVGELDPSFSGFIDSEAEISHLLSHTSGIFDYFDEETIEDFDNFKVRIPWNELETPSDYFPLFQGETMKFKGGERFSYSNGGYVFLGIIIEKLSGKLYRDFVREEILEPAGMKRSGFYAFDNLPENTAWGYLENREQTNIYKIPVRGGGDGGLYTTVEDMHCFWNSFFEYKILGKELTEKFLETTHSYNEAFGCGYGIYKKLDDSLFYTSGVDAGVGFHSFFVPEKKLAMTWLSNVSEGGEELCEVIFKHLQDCLL